MGSLKIVLMCFICLSVLPGGIKSGKIMKDDCSSRFLSSLIEAGYEIDNTVDLTLNLQYEDDEGVKKKAAIKLRDQCKEPKILCDGETDFINGEMITGPLLLCSWKWDENDETTKNNVIVRLNHKKTIEISGSVSQDSEKFFPHSSAKGLLNFKFTTPNLNHGESKKTYRVKREEETADYDESLNRDSEEGPPPPKPPPTTPHPPPPPPTTPPPTTPPPTTPAPTTTTEIVASKAQSISRVTNKLTYVLWAMGGYFLMFALK